MEREQFQYAVLRVVPRLEREEFVNVGVILFCRTRRFLAARTHIDAARVTALCPGLDLAEIRRHLDCRRHIAAGAADGGPLATLPQSERFHWLVAPSSTIIQTSSVHTGLCDDPARTLDHLLHRLVLCTQQADHEG